MDRVIQRKIARFNNQIGADENEIERFKQTLKMVLQALFKRNRTTNNRPANKRLGSFPSFSKGLVSIARKELFVAAESCN